MQALSRLLEYEVSFYGVVRDQNAHIKQKKIPSKWIEP